MDDKALHDWRCLDEQTPRHRVETLRQWRADAEAGDADAQFRLGTAFLYGHAVPVDDAEASKWLLMAARAGHQDSVFHLAGLYARHGNLAEAARLYRQAAENGSASALYQLGVLAYRGGDAREAAQWLRQAAKRGHRDAYEELDRLTRMPRPPG